MTDRAAIRRAPRMTVDDVGNYYVKDDGSVWQLLVYSAEPTATLVRCERSGESLDVQRSHVPRISGVVGAPIFNGFQRLVPEADRA